MSADFPRSFRYYRDVLGLPLDWGTPEDGYAQFRVGGQVVALLERTRMEPISGREPGVRLSDQFVLSFRVDDVDIAFAELVSKGAVRATVPHDRSDWGYRVAHLRDPDDNLIELYAPIGQA